MRGLLIAEKPSLRRTIETVYNKHKSEIPYEITFMEQRGHLLTLKYPGEIDEDQKEWCWENLPFHPEDHGGWQYKVIQEAKKGSFLTSQERYDAIRDELKNNKYDFVINAGDPDQEGELLIRIVLSALHNTLPVKRYWSNETTENKVLEALKNLRDDDHDPMLVNLLKAAYGRQHSDYRYGMNITRAATLKLGTKAACGRVKTPIQSIVCQREKEIENFVPSTCYGVTVKYNEGFTGQYVNLEEVEEQDEEKSEDRGTVWFKTEAEAHEFIDSLYGSARVTSFETKREETYAPKLFKLATAQIACGKYGLDSSQTLAIIQSLYEKGYISYPRTDCEYISSSEDFGAMIKSASAVPVLQPFIKSIVPGVTGKVKACKKWVNDKKLEEAGHSALVPTAKAPEFETLSGEEKTVYSLICRQFVAIFLPALVQDKVAMITDICGNTFRSTGKKLIDPGYTKIFGTKFTDVDIPIHVENDLLDVDGYDVAKKTTVCPKRFTDADIIALCEAPQKYLNDKSLKALGKRLVIGTPATRSSIINELIESNHYLQRVKDGKVTHVIPTEIGMQIWENLKDLDICKIDMTGQWEEQLERIRSGALELPDFEQGMRHGVETLIQNIKDNTDMTVIRSAQKKVICKCPSCGGEVVSAAKSFYCLNRRDKGCEIGAYKKICESTIADKDFVEMLNGGTITMTVRNNGKSWKQDVRYDFENNKVIFVRDELKASAYKCPKCGAELSEDNRKFVCSQSCGFELWKTVPGGKELTIQQIDSFFKTGNTGLIKNMKSKKGSTFDASLLLNDDKTGTKFEFAPRK